MIYLQSGFTPRDLDPEAWWDAADATTITVSSGDVSQWDDRSGNGYHVAQGTTANQPRYGDATLNGISVLSFTAGNGERLNGTTTGFSALANGCTVCAVARSGANASSKIVLSQALGTGTAATTYLQALDTEQWHSNVAGAAIGVGATGVTTWKRHAVIIPAGAGNTVTIEQDGGAATATSTATTSGTAANGVFRVGTNPADSGARFLGDIAEIIVFGAVLTADQRARIDDYFVKKWGL